MPLARCLQNRYILVLFLNLICCSNCFIVDSSKNLKYLKYLDKSFSKHNEPQIVDETIISGIQPSGKLHLGNYFGCIHPCLQAQNAGKSINFMIANLHSFTNMSNCSIEDNINIAGLTREALALVLACGLDPSHGTRIYYQSHIDNILKLNWIISCLLPPNKIEGLLRIRKYKDMSFGLVCYPVLMSADILAIRANKVIANKDQMPHVELSRFAGKKLNNYLGYDFFPATEIDISNSSSIMSLLKPSEKMSKYNIDDDSRINLLDAPDRVRDKIKGAVTDSLMGITNEPENRPSISNLIKIFSKCSGVDQNKIACDFSDSGFLKFKNSVAEAVIEFLKPIQARYNEIIKDTTYMDNVINEGAEKIIATSNEVIKEFDMLL